MKMAVVLQSVSIYGAESRFSRVRWEPRFVRGRGRRMLTVKGSGEQKKRNKCTADELHYVSVSNSDWHLALWRYLPSSTGPTRNHPLLLLSGVGNKAIGFDLSPQSSFARFMSAQGFDTWILEVRNAGLSEHGGNLAQSRKYSEVVKLKGTYEEDSQGESDLQGRVTPFSPILSNEGQWTVLPQIFDLQERLYTTLEDLQKEFDIIGKKDWDFDHYVEEDVPVVMDYIKTVSKPKDGKLLAIGHSMGGILLYAMLSREGFEGKESRLAAVTTLASSLDYTSSNSSLKYLLFLADPVQAINLPIFPIGALIAAAHPLVARPPYILSWLSSQISAEDMMQPELFDKLCLNNFCTVPSKVLLQLTTAFEKGGLRDRSGTFFYKDHLGKSKVPVLALAGDQDQICPPEAVYETAKLIPEHLHTYKVLGEPRGPHYAHYDLVGSRLAVDQVYPSIIKFLAYHDVLK